MRERRPRGGLWGVSGDPEAGCGGEEVSRCYLLPTEASPVCPCLWRNISVSTRPRYVHNSNATTDNATYTKTHHNSYPPGQKLTFFLIIFIFILYFFIFYF